jgi:dihydrodipicolinate synthase/N-acetylneuraminate lyase
MSEVQRLGVPLAQLTRTLFCKPNPVPLKYVLSLFGLMPQNVRLPLVELSPQTKAEVAAAMAKSCGEYGEYLIGTVSSSRATERLAVAT